MNNSTRIFFHIALMNNYQSIVDELVTDIDDSGLYSLVDNIDVGLVGGHKKQLNTLPDKYNIKFESSNLKLYEKPTLTMLHEHSKSYDGKVLYIHTKNARNKTPIDNREPKIWKTWASREVHRRYMSNFMIYNHTECMNLLFKHDAVGCDFRNTPENTSHFAGNFWWANCDYIRTLPAWDKPMFRITGTMGRNPRHYCERWLLCYNNEDNNMDTPRHKCLFWGAECRKRDSNINKILNLSKREQNDWFDEMRVLQHQGKFPKRI